MGGGGGGEGGRTGGGGVHEDVALEALGQVGHEVARDDASRGQDQRVDRNLRDWGFEV